MNAPRPAVVLVDDEKPYLDFLADMLAGNLGWNVHTFSRPRDALAALANLDVGVIVTDYSMPEQNGFEFVRAVAELRPGVPCIMITGHAVELADEPLARSAPLCALLAKPFGWRRLAEQIVQHAPEFASTMSDTEPFASA